MSVYVGFKIGKAMERKAYISEYYCGACGLPVSDHDSYCPECGGAFRKEDATERTCRMTKKGPEFVLAGWWECSECGPVYPPCNDEIAVWALQKCPRCGAKVIANEQ